MLRHFLFAMAMACLALPSAVAAEVGLEEKTVLNGKLTVLVPKGFKQMSAAMIKKKYPSERRPTLVFTNSAANVNVAINHTQTVMPYDQLEEALEPMVAVFNQLHPDAEWIRKEVTKINDRNFVVLQLRTEAVDTSVHNVMAATSVDGRMLIVTFNCTKKLEDTWLEAGKKIIEGIKVK